MNNNEIIQVCGSVHKIESLVEIDWGILEKTSVAEANMPYANYYGNVPQNAIPNSLFLFTSRFYFLDEILSSVRSFSSLSEEKIHVASSILQMHKGQFPAIRVKHFPNYKNIHLLQTHFIKEDIKLATNIHIADVVETKTYKCFKLEKLKPGIFLDCEEKNKGYVVLKKRMNRDGLIKTINEIRNNSNCKLFDAAQVNIIQNSEVIEMVRIFSEGLNFAFLECLKEEFAKRSN